MTELTDEAVKTLAAARPGNLFVDQDEDVCIDDGRKFNLIFCPARDDVELEGDWPVLNPEVVAEIVARYNIAPVIARALIDARAENARLRADAQAAVALVLEQAGLAVANVEIGFHDGISGEWHPMAGPSIISAACAAIRALADADGIAAVEAMRKERDLAAAQNNRLWAANHNLVAEQDALAVALAAELDAAQQREAKLREAGARLLGHATQDMSEQMDAWDAFEAALSNNGRGE